MSLKNIMLNDIMLFVTIIYIHYEYHVRPNVNYT